MILKIVYYYSPIFAALASLREIFRVSVVALPRHGYTPDKVPTAGDTALAAADQESRLDSE
jgi:hypothetical protein